jgi:dTMP kinase
LICFEGIDGAGKSTIARMVVSALVANGTSAQLVERKDPNCGTDELTQRMKLLRELIWEYGDVPISELGDYHALYNMASWYAALDRRKIQPVLLAGSTAIVDNWYFKFLSRFVLKGTIDIRHLRACFAQLTRPNLIVYLDVKAEVAATRKREFGKGETGFFDGFGQPSRENFVRYQGEVQKVMNNMAMEEGWFSIDVGERSPDEIAFLVVEAIERQFPSREHST